MTRLDTNNLDQLRELLNIGAGHAAGAFAQLVGRTFWMHVPRVVALDETAEPSPDAVADVSWSSATSVIFEVHGSVQGLVALLLPPEARDALVARLLGGGTAPFDPHLVESALEELGNIVVSHVCSAIADTLGARLVPSVPVLATGRAPIAARLAAADGATLRVETEIVDADGDLRGLLVFFPGAAPI
jgi:chemotaxis protein CheC